MRRGLSALALLACVTLARAAAAADQATLAINTAIDGPALTFDWPALEIGVGSYEAGPTGLTIVRFKNRAAVAVDVRGGGPGTVNTDILRLAYASSFIDAIVFAGGSSYGEEAITAVATGLKDIGARSAAWHDIALVPGAIIFDLGDRRLNDVYPDKRLAQAALRARRPGVFPLGAQGAGRMAMQGGYFGCQAHSGQGGAFRQIGATKLAAFVVVNAYGAITDRAGKLVRCQRAPGWGALDSVSALLQHLPDSAKPDWRAASVDAGLTRNTTVSLVVTSQKLPPAQLQRLAVQVHTSMARAIQPFSTAFDGDTLFAASTQETDNAELSPLTLGVVAGELMWDAVLASVPPEPSVAPPALIAVPPERLAGFVGTYTVGSLGRITVRVVDLRLTVEAIGKTPVYEFEVGKPRAVLPVSDREFVVDGRYHTRIAFVTDAAGKATGTVVNPGRWEQRGERIAD